MPDFYTVQYFLGANSPQGFYSLYSELIDPETAKTVYILKGGPGCGKSTLMKQVAARLAQEMGAPCYRVEELRARPLAQLVRGHSPAAG